MSTGRVVSAARKAVVWLLARWCLAAGLATGSQVCIRGRLASESAGARCVAACLMAIRRLEQWRPVTLVVALSVGPETRCGPSNMPLQLTAAGRVELQPRVCCPWWVYHGLADGGWCR